MCILIYYPSTKMPDPAHLREACINNPDGFGWAVIAGSQILTGHSMLADEAIDEFLAVRDLHRDGDALFHARITTHGSTSIDNCHPFWVSGRSDMVLAHNGMMPCQPRPGDRRSDTRIFAEEVLMRDFRRLDREKTIKRLSSWVGYSKVLILSTNPALKQSAYLINASMGKWVSGVWFSNDTYKPDPWGSYAHWYGALPKVLGPSLDDETVWVCRDPACNRTADYCECYAPEFESVRREDLFQVRKPGHVETDDPDTWWCRGCNMIGWISTGSLQCGQCRFQYCCDMPGTACQCWEPGPVGVDQRAWFVAATQRSLSDRRFEQLF